MAKVSNLVLKIVIGATLGLLVKCCTYVQVPYEDTYMIGRTMELQFAFLEKHWTVQTVPRGWKYPLFPLPEIGAEQENVTSSFRVDPGNLGRPSHGVAKYGFVAAFGGFGKEEAQVELVTDGMNEHGVSFSAHTFRRAVYQEHTEEARKAKLHLQYLAIGSYILGSFKSTKECVETLRSGDVAIVAPNYLPAELHLHFSIADGESSVVLEFVEGQMKIHENSVGVMTNDPEYPFHLHYLNIYSNISPHNPDRSKDIGTTATEIGEVPVAFSHGFNLVGLPGDYTPPSRFVRMFYLRELALHESPPKTEAEALRLVTALVNQVAIPKGSIAKMNPVDFPELTQWAVVKMPKSKRFLFRTYNNNQWQAINLKKLEGFFKEATSPTILPVFSEDDGVADITNAFVPK